MKVAFDIGGTLGKYPTELGGLAAILERGGAEVFVLTDIPSYETAAEILARHGIEISRERLLCADYQTHGDRCKAVLVREHQIDLLIDDHAAYCADAGCVTLFVWPDPHRPYEAPSRSGGVR